MTATSSIRAQRAPAIRNRYRVVSLTMGALAMAMAAAALLGPLVLNEVRYRTSPTTLNQILGAATLFVVAPLGAAYACRRRSSAGALLASGVGVFGIYTYAQLVIGQEYLRLPGNVEWFFPLSLAVSVLAWVTVVLAWRAVSGDLPAPMRSPSSHRCPAW